jgi:hypothetical protein
MESENIELLTLGNTDYIAQQSFTTILILHVV